MNFFNPWLNYREKPKVKSDLKPNSGKIVALRVKEIDLAKLISPDNPVTELQSCPSIGVSDVSYRSNRRIGDRHIYIFARRIVNISGAFFTIIAQDIVLFNSGMDSLAFEFSLHSENKKLHSNCVSKSREVCAEFERIRTALIAHLSSK